MADSATPTKKEPTAQEAMLFYAILKHMKNKADVDWNGVAEDAGFKNASVAKVRFGQIKKKLGLDGDNSPSKGGKAGDAPISAPTTPTRVTKPRARGSGSGKAKAKGAGRARSKTVDAEEPAKDEDEDDDFEAPVKVKNELGIKDEEFEDDGAVFRSIRVAT